MNLRILFLACAISVVLPVHSQSTSSDTIFCKEKVFYNTLNFQSDEVTVLWEGDFDNINDELDGSGVLTILKKIGEPPVIREVGRVEGVFRDGLVHGEADVEVGTIYSDGTVRNVRMQGFFEDGRLLNYDLIYGLLQGYLETMDYSDYFQIKEINGFSYRIFFVEITSAPFCEDLVMGFRASARIYFTSEDRIYDFYLTLRKANMFEPLQYKLVGNNRFTTEFITDKGLDDVGRFVFQKNMEAIGLSEPLIKTGIDQYKNTFGFWIEDLPDSILDVAREKIYLASITHNEKNDNVRPQSNVLSGVFRCKRTNQIFYFQERGAVLLTSDLDHSALTKFNRYNYQTEQLRYLDDNKFDFETFEKVGALSITKRYNVLQWPKRENNYSAVVKNGEDEYILELIFSRMN